MIERANQVDAPGPAQPAPGSDSQAVSGRTGIRHALVGILMVVAWLVVCLLLRRVF